jgi:hypothetical protein
MLPSIWCSTVDPLVSYRRFAVVSVLPSSGKQPPTIKPKPTAPANTSPHGRSIDCQNKNFRLTMLAFWTDSNAIVTTQAATIVEIIKFVILLVFPVLPRTISSCFTDRHFQHNRSRCPSGRLSLFEICQHNNQLLGCASHKFSALKEFHKS